MTECDTCPKCGASWVGEPIPENQRELFGGKTHFSRRINVYDRGKDRTVALRCPDCGDQVARDWEASK